MCDICHSSPCLPRCPNAPEPRTFDYCHECGDDIREGEEYINEGVPLCMECIENMTAKDLVDFLDIDIKTAELHEPEYEPDFDD